MSTYTDLLKIAANAIHRPLSELSLDTPFEEQNLDSIDLVEILLAKLHLQQANIKQMIKKLFSKNGVDLKTKMVEFTL